MDPALSSASTPAPIAFEDGLGTRRLALDRSRNETVEMLCLRGDLTGVPSFEFALRERLSHLAVFSHACYNRVRSVERLKDPASTLALVSDATAGTRLSEILRFAEAADVTLDVDAALCLLRQLVPAIAMLHENIPDIAHGAIGVERLVVTPHARLVVVEHVLGSALEQLRYSQERYWRELRIAVPRSPGPPRFDHRTDATQLGAVALSLILGRRLHEEEGPARLGDLVSSAWAVSARGGLEPLPAGLRAWMMCALQLDPRNSFESAIDAQEELERVLGESDYLAAPATLEAFLERYRAAAEPAAAPEPTRTIHVAAPEPVYVPMPEPRPILGQPSVSQPATTPLISRPAVRPVIALDPESAIELTPIATPTPSVRPPSSARMPVASRPTPPPAAVPAAAPVQAYIPTPAPAAVAPPLPMPSIPAPVPVAPVVAAAEPVSSSADTRRDLFAAPLDMSPSFGEEHEHEAKAPRSGKRWGLAAAAIALIALAGAGVPAARRLVAPSPAANDGTLVMNSNPPGAKVFVDGVERGVTPLTVSLKAGAHALELRGDGPARLMPITMTAGAQVSQYIELPKTSTFGQLQVRTEPAGAHVTVDGVARGNSPVTVADLTPGEHAVTLESDRGSVKQIVAIEAGITASLMVPLAGAPDGAPISGWIAVTAPADVQVFENKRLLGTSQSDRLMVSAGRHDVDIVNETLGYRTQRTIQVSPGKVTPIKIEFPKGTIALNAVPWAEVWVDGEKVGETPIGNLSLTIGAHEIVFRHPDLGEQRHAAMVTLNSPARLSVDLRKK
ncbi:MAG: PEGA domain-containing protein [Vicinamibacterales bacterium]